MNPTLISAVAVVKLSSLTTRSLVAAICAMSLLARIGAVHRALAVTPGEILPPLARIWTPLTGGFIENDIISVAVDVASIFFAGSLLEQHWGQLEWVKFVVGVNTVAMLAAALTYIAGFVVTQNLEYLFFAQFVGFSGALAGFLVAYRQLYPQSRVTLCGCLVVDSRVRASLIASRRVRGNILRGTQFGPLAMCGLQLLLYLSGLFSAWNFVAAVHGVVWAWVYLRFYQPHQSGGGRGDTSDAFAFDIFFPNPVQPIARAVLRRVHAATVAVGLCRPERLAFDLGAPTGLTVGGGAGSRFADAERRRQTALRDLERRVTATAESGPPTQSAAGPGAADLGDVSPVSASIPSTLGAPFFSATAVATAVAAAVTLGPPANI